jgi:hypothetical protein
MLRESQAHPYTRIYSKGMEVKYHSIVENFILVDIKRMTSILKLETRVEYKVIQQESLNSSE